MGAVVAISDVVVTKPGHQSIVVMVTIVVAVVVAVVVALFFLAGPFPWQPSVFFSIGFLVWPFCCFSIEMFGHFCCFP